MPRHNGRITRSHDELATDSETVTSGSEGGRTSPPAKNSCDYLLVDGAPRRAFTSPEDALGHQLHDIAELNPDDLELVTRFIDALVTKTRLKTLTNTIN
ncbi:MAG: hypothetical protein GY701_17875 [Sulfitobacter sp.]|nr:hypothetical protein [Sulfitobacter sp.]